MSKNYIDEQTFERIDFTVDPLPKGEYTQCRFIHCNFAKADIAGIAFMECSFESCDLTLAGVFKTALREVRFTDCKLLGLSFDQCNGFLFSIRPERCNMASCSFRGMRLEKAIFRHCSLEGADFSEAVLSGAVLEECDLLNAVFDRTDLTKADLRTARHYLIDPERNKVKGARFSLSEVGGLLAKYGVVLDP